MTSCGSKSTRPISKANPIPTFSFFFMLKDTTPTQQIKDRKAIPNHFNPKFQPKNLIIQSALNKFNPLVYFYSATQPPV
jgi:hypothetical protein